MLTRLVKEPPFRLLGKAAARHMPCSIRTKCFWDAMPRNNYLMGILAAADQAKSEGVSAITVIEFGVAAGNGLIAMQRFAESVERETGVRIFVIGFDSGCGLPPGTADYRDHPDEWKGGDFPMDVSWLRSQLGKRTELILGDVAETTPAFVPGAPIGFVSFDLDLYSSTKHAMQVLRTDTLNRVFMYFDDIRWTICHRRAGEWLALSEFNEENATLFIDQWHGISRSRPFPEADWLDCMFICHKLEAISSVSLKRQAFKRVGEKAELLR
jgi:hypothetical protein